MKFSKYTFGAGDRFSHQGEAQLQAVVKANQAGVEVCPVWNKSNREHGYVKTGPDDVRVEADATVKALGFDNSYYVDADHINLSTVAPYVKGSDFFTLDVAAFIGNESSKDAVDAFLASCEKYKGELNISGIADSIQFDDSKLPSVEEVNDWTGEKFANTLRHIPGHPKYNPNFRQLIHVGYKVAAEMGDRYYQLLEANAEVIGRCVEENIFDRHLKRLFFL